MNLEQAVDCLHQGKIVIYPTETFYGLGVDIQNPQAIKRLFEVKQRAASKAVSILLGSLSQVDGLVAEISNFAQRLMHRFLPGPLTLVLPASPRVDESLQAQTGWIGLRQSPHPLAQKLVESFGRPITTTSANPSGGASAVLVSQIEAYFAQSDLYFLEGGDLPPSSGSTVVKVENNELILLREGEIPWKDLKTL